MTFYRLFLVAVLVLAFSPITMGETTKEDIQDQYTTYDKLLDLALRQMKLLKQADSIITELEEQLEKEEAEVEYWKEIAQQRLEREKRLEETINELIEATMGGKWSFSLGIDKPLSLRLDDFRLNLRLNYEF